MADDGRGTPDEHDATSDGADQARIPWWSRAPQGAALEMREHSNQSFLVKFYAVIPLMVGLFFLPGALRPVWIALIVIGYTVWSLRSMRRRAAARRAPGAADGGSSDGGPSGGPGGAPSGGPSGGDSEDPRTPGA